jgi:hypothetical protein
MKPYLCRTCKQKFRLWSQLDEHLKENGGHEGIDMTFHNEALA